MPDYEEMYFRLLQSVADTIDNLNQAMVDAEDILLNSCKSEDDISKNKRLKKNIRRVYAHRKE